MVYISGLPRRIRDSEMKEKLEKYGKLIELNIVRDPFTKDSRGFGFVTFENKKDALEAIENMNKSEYDGRTITVEASKRNRAHKPTPGAYLGPNLISTRPRRSYSNDRKKRYRSRSRSKSRSRSYKRDYRRRE